MKPHVSGITLGVDDVERAKRLYSEGLGWPVEMDAQDYLAFSINNGTAAFGLLSREALASANSVSSERSGFSGVLLSYVVSSNDRVDEVLSPPGPRRSVIRSSSPPARSWAATAAASPTRTASCGTWRWARVSRSRPNSDPSTFAPV
jgi:catechol 2,3-dioxygenase-like lactoylglutathione lyase family enzyme